MNCQELAKQIEIIDPELDPTDVARLCLLILNQDPGEDTLNDLEQLKKCWKNVAFRLGAAADQHAAVSEELAEFCSGGPVEFSPDDLWMLMRALKVQSQLLEFYLDEPALV